MDLSPIPDGLAAVAAGLMVFALMLSVLIVWRRRSAVDHDDAGPDESVWGGPSWTAYAADEAPAVDDERHTGWARTVARQQPVADERPQPELPERHQLERHQPAAQLLDDHDLSELTVGMATVPSPRTADDDLDMLPTLRPSPRPAGAQTAAVAAAPQGSSRDRLFAVLLADHESVVGALDELAACQQRLSHLSSATDRERGTLTAVLSRLRNSGLRPEQLSRLADIPVGEVDSLLRSRVAESSS